MVVDSELLQTFREETGERLDRMVTTLLGLETDTADVELLATLFRDAHSIKGNAGMLGFGEAHTIAHAMEDVIHSADQNGTLGPSLIDPLLGATDAIRAVVGGSTGLAAAATARRRMTSRKATIWPRRPRARFASTRARSIAC
mgnify:CR=1 FL=1